MKEASVSPQKKLARRHQILSLLASSVLKESSVLPKKKLANRDQRGNKLANKNLPEEIKRHQTSQKKLQFRPKKTLPTDIKETSNLPKNGKKIAKRDERGIDFLYFIRCKILYIGVARKCLRRRRRENSQYTQYTQIYTIYTNMHNTLNIHNTHIIHKIHNIYTHKIWKAFQAEPHPSLDVWYLTTSLICSTCGVFLVWSLYSVLTTFQHNFYVSNASLFGIEQSLKSNMSGESEGSLYSTCITGRPLSFWIWLRHHI